MQQPHVVRVDLGWFVRPPAETGTGSGRVEPVLGYLVEHADGLLLMDTGLGHDDEVDAHYRPRRRSIATALAAVGHRVDEIDLVVNCHLHFDHCGGNPLFTDRPIFTQRAELAAARAVDYTLPDLLDAPGLRYVELDGAADVLAGVRIVPTPGHTVGHQSLVVRAGDGTVTVVAGQSHETASGYSADALAWRAARQRPDPALPSYPEWIDLLQSLDPARVVFAHDNAVWEP